MVGTTMGLMDMNMLIYFMGIDNCKFRRKVVPGDVLRMTRANNAANPVAGANSKGVATGLTGELAAEASLLR
jgi:3-hydroxyacyl-[acyl-carrier-protein] dehydratase